MKTVVEVPKREKEVINGYLERAKASEIKIPQILKDGCGFTPFDDMVVYMIICTPRLSEEELKGIDTKVLDVIFEGDAESEVTNQKLILITKGNNCVKTMSPGDRIAVRGNAFKITTPQGTFLTVREHDVIGKYGDKLPFNF